MNISIEKWKKIKNHLNNEQIASLNPPASSSDINELEKAIKHKIPEDFKNFIKIHNGQSINSIGIFNGLSFLSTKHIYSNWSIWKELLDYGDFSKNTVKNSPEILADWWNISWIPFTDNGSGDHLCIDLSPSISGTYGQIIEVLHDNNTRTLISNSFSEWLNFFIKREIKNE